tara:strand:+ start:92 stop:424 length:333 start_codon:yes stop_codon:yes gene_type:complete
MKFTRSKLKKLIDEVISENTNTSMLLEMPQPPIVGQEQTGDYTKDPDAYDGDLARRSLYHMARQADQLHDMVRDDDELVPEISEKISLAADYLEQAFKFITYDKQNPEGR